MSTQLTLVPALGRDYANQADLLADWEAGKDFRIEDASSPYNGAYVNLADARSSALRAVTVYYARLTKALTITIQ